MKNQPSVTLINLRLFARTFKHSYMMLTQHVGNQEKNYLECTIT